MSKPKQSVDEAAEEFAEHLYGDRRKMTSLQDQIQFDDTIEVFKAGAAWERQRTQELVRAAKDLAEINGFSADTELVQALARFEEGKK